MTIERKKPIISDMGEWISLKLPPETFSVLFEPHEAREFAQKLNELSDLIDVRQAMES